jgi:tRNA threonylcarbamoyl adenosine modification protein YjeE
VKLERTLTSLADTDRVAAALAPLLRTGDTLTLSGDLGSGKTTLVRALAGAIGIDTALVSSPTYVIANQYPNPRGLRLAHVDCYRLSSPEDLDAIGWDLLTDGTWVLAIEWPERVGGVGAGAIRPDALRLHLAHGPARGDSESRLLTISVPDEWLARPELPGLARAMRTHTRCPVTGEPVPPDSPSYPFSSERARMADLNKWLTGGHAISRPLDADDLVGD